MKNVLLCDNEMVIGGVETAILNQIVVFKKRGYNVYVVAGSGPYSERVEELGGNFIECEFPEENEINTERINKLVSIIKEKKISEIHIHKYQCIPSVMPAAFITGIPYFAYEHSIKDTTKYYTWNYPIYKLLFPIYFRNAYKIIAITPKVAEYTKNDYKISKERYEIIHNGIDFDIYKNDMPKLEGNIQKVMIVSRLSEEKLETIFEGIELFEKLLYKYPDAKLEIIGGGIAENKIEQFLENKKLDYSKKIESDAKVKFLGEQNDVIKFLKQADLLLGVDRCVLEAIAIKIPTVVTGYTGLKGLITLNNIDLAIEENFSGNNMKTISIDECIEQITELENNRKMIVEQNYKVATEKLDCYKNYINMPEGIKLEFDWIDLFLKIKKMSDLTEEQIRDIKGKYDWIQKIEGENVEAKDENKKLEKENEQLKKQNENIEGLREKNKVLQEELEKVYNSKRWRYTEKIKGMFHKKRLN